MLASRTSVVPADYHWEAAPGGHSVAITFDDALASALDYAIPELRARRMPATIFVPAGALGVAPNWQKEDDYADSGELVATADALRASLSDLVQLGAHSLTHPYLSRLCSQNARLEIAGCREQMGQIFGIDVRIFAFPYGDHNPAIVELCREAGYERVFTNIPSPVDPTSGGFVRGRVLVEPWDGPIEFYLKMSGAYAWMAYVSATKRWLRSHLRR
jgi:peptidoglycan/xylan/chitin deacetylase (PgdA/CDA1 family)